jgi:SPP1 family predicted phage head-tail adaptor
MMDTPINLLDTTTTKDSNGYRVEEVTQKTDIFAEKKSIRQSEHYQAAAAGFNVEIMFLIWSIEYAGEKYIEYKSKVYQIERTYNTGDLTELMCSLKGVIEEDGKIKYNAS